MKMTDEREVLWIGSSLKDLKKLPEAVQDEIGFILGRVQKGKDHHHIKQLKGFSAVVMEIISEYRTDTFRLVYAPKIAGEIYVLHAFKKKSKKGIKTPKEDIEVIKSRLQAAINHAKEQQKND